MYILNENVKAIAYLVLGLMISFVVCFKVIDEVSYQKEKKLVYLNSLFSCQQSLLFMGNKSLQMSRIVDYCEKSAKEYMDGYVSLTDQLENSKKKRDL